jgi:hypothetical protein
LSGRVPEQKTRFLWCGGLTKSSSANNGSELTQVGGVLSVVICHYKCLFCKLGPNLSKFHPERNAFAVAVIWTNGRMDKKIIIPYVHFIKYKY